MTEQDIFRQLTEQLRTELNREANEVIEKLVKRFRCEIGKYKTSLVAEMLNRIEIIARNNDVSQEIVFQINIKTGEKQNEMCSK